MENTDQLRENKTKTLKCWWAPERGPWPLFQGDGRILRQAGVRVNRHQGCLSAGRSGETQPCGQPPVQKHGSKGLATQASLAPEVPCAQGGEQAVASPRLPRGTQLATWATTRLPHHLLSPPGSPLGVRQPLGDGPEPGQPVPHLRDQTPAQDRKSVV